MLQKPSRSALARREGVKETQPTKVCGEPVRTRGAYSERLRARQVHSMIRGVGETHQFVFVESEKAIVSAIANAAVRALFSKVDCMMRFTIL